MTSAREAALKAAEHWLYWWDQSQKPKQDPDTGWEIKQARDAFRKALQAIGETP